MINACFFILGLILGSGCYILLSRVFARVDGAFIVDDSEDSETTRWTLEVKGDPYSIKDKKMVHFKVINEVKGDEL
jgi:hypothetical protein